MRYEDVSFKNIKIIHFLEQYQQSLKSGTETYNFSNRKCHLSNYFEMFVVPKNQIIYNGEEKISKFFLRTTFKAPKHLTKLSHDYVYLYFLKILINCTSYSMYEHSFIEHLIKKSSNIKFVLKSTIFANQ